MSNQTRPSNPEPAADESPTETAETICVLADGTVLSPAGGVAWCSAHHGVRNEDESGHCDMYDPRFDDGDDVPDTCVFHDLFFRPDMVVDEPHVCIFTGTEPDCDERIKVARSIIAGSDVDVEGVSFVIVPTSELAVA